MVTLEPALTASLFSIAPLVSFVALIVTELEAPFAVTAPVLVMPLFVAVMPIEPPVASTVEPLEMLLPASMVMPVAALTAALLVRVVLAFSVNVVPAVTAPVFSILPLPLLVSMEMAPLVAVTASLMMLVPAVRVMLPPELLIVISPPVLLSIAVPAFMVMALAALTLALLVMVPVEFMDTDPPAVTASLLVIELAAERIMSPVVDRVTVVLFSPKVTLPPARVTLLALIVPKTEMVVEEPLRGTVPLVRVLTSAESFVVKLVFRVPYSASVGAITYRDPALMAPLAPTAMPLGLRKNRLPPFWPPRPPWIALTVPLMLI